MLDFLKFGFLRMSSSGGKLDSMCPRCFASLTKNGQEFDLEGMDDGHVCRSSGAREFQPTNGELP
jgi:hypothetical protein